MLTWLKKRKREKHNYQYKKNECKREITTSLQTLK